MPQLSVALNPASSPIWLWLWERETNLSANFWIMWAPKCVLEVVRNVELSVTMRALLTSWVVSLLTVGPRRKLDICRCAGTCKFVIGDVSKRFCWLISFSYVLVLVLHFPLVFVCGIIMVDIRFVDELVWSASLSMKKASWGYCVLVFKSSGELAALPGVGYSGDPGDSGTEFEVARTTTCEEGADVTMKPLMDLELTLGQFCFCISRDSSRLTAPTYFSSSWDPCSRFWRRHFQWNWDEETEEIDECQDDLPSSPFSATFVFPDWILEAESEAALYCSRFSTMVCINSNEDASIIAPWQFLIFVVSVPDQFAADLAITPINATGHQLVTYCRCICAEERAQILDLIVTIEYCFVWST